MKGCRSLQIVWSRMKATMARVSSLAGPSAPCRTGLASSSIPVAEDVPDEPIGGVGRIVEPVALDARRTSATALAPPRAPTG